MKGLSWDRKGWVHLGPVESYLQWLIIANMILFAVDTLPQLSSATRHFLDLAETVSVIIFSIEFVVRVSLSRPPRGYLFSFYGVVDLLAIVPFYLGLGFDTRSLRVFRLFRLLRAFKLARHNLALDRLQRALEIARPEVTLFGIVTAIILYLASVGIYFFENAAQPEVFASVFHSLWWAIVTLTTVGYGDAVPQTAGGRILTGIVLIIGMGIVAVPTSIFTAALSRARSEQEKGELAERGEESGSAAAKSEHSMDE